MSSELTTGEAATWGFIQRLTVLAQGVVEQRIRAAANLSTAEFEVLRCLADTDGEARQNALATTLGWDKSRLSHQLTRMEHRELIERRKHGRVHAVAMTRVGAQKLDLAGSAHAAAVRALLVDHLSAAELESLARTARMEEERLEAEAARAAEATRASATKQRPLRPRTT